MKLPLKAMFGDRRAWAWGLALFIVQFALVTLSRKLFVFPPYENAAIWMPAGTAIAVLARAPLSAWLPCVLAIWLAQVIGMSGSPAPLAIAVPIAAALRSIAGAAIYRSWERMQLLSEVRGVLGVVLAALTAPLIGATIVSTTIVLAIGSQLSFLEVWLSWYLSELLGVLLVTPAVFAWWQPRSPWKIERPLRLLELACAIVLAMLATELVFSDALQQLRPYLRGNLWIPVLFWLALRGGARSVTLGTLLVAGIALWNTVQGRFLAFRIEPGTPLTAAVQYTQEIFIIFGLIALILAAAQTEKQRALDMKQSLVESAAVLSTSLDYRTNFTRLANQTVPAVASSFAVWLTGGAEPSRRLVAHAGLKREVEAELLSRARHSLDAMSSWPFSDGGALLVPFHGREDWTGLLGMTFPGRPHVPDPHERAFAQQLAYQCALALENSQLYAQAQSAVARRDEFLANAAHELRTPLTAATLRLNRLEKSMAGATDVAHTQLSLVRRALRRLHRLAESILEVSAINQGKLALQREEVDVGLLLDDVCIEAEDGLARAGCELRREGAPHLLAWVDGRRVQHALREVLANAIKFGAGKPITVSATAIDRFVELAISDEGIGIRPEDREHVLTPFGRAVSSSHFGGLGLGLYLTQQIAQAHGGSVEITGSSVHRTTVVLRLPTAPAAALPAAAPFEVHA